MFYTELCNIEKSDLIAIAAFLVSLLAALYTRRAWIEANRANELTLLKHRKEILDAFIALKSHMIQNGNTALLSEVSKFYYPSRDACIYFEPNLAKLITDYQSACFIVADLSRLTGLMECEKIKIKDNLEKSEELASKIEKSIYSVISHVSGNS